MQGLTNLDLELQLQFPGSVCSWLIALLDAMNVPVCKANLAELASAAMPEGMLEICSLRALQVALVHLLKDRVLPLLPHLKSLQTTACKVVANDAQLKDIVTLDDIDHGVRVNQTPDAVLSFSGAIKTLLKTGVKNPLDNSPLTSLCFVRKESATTPVFPALLAAMLNFADLLGEWIDDLSSDFTVASALQTRNEMFDMWNTMSFSDRHLLVIQLEQFGLEWNLCFPLLSTFRLKLMLQTSSVLPLTTSGSLTLADGDEEGEEDDLSHLAHVSHFQLTVQDIQDLVQEALHFLDEAHAQQQQEQQQELP